jgi:hypothetical protein
MSYNYIGKAAFGNVLKNNITNVIDRRKSKILLCNTKCRKIIAPSYDYLYLYVDKNNTLKNNINKKTLNINLYTSLDIPHDHYEINLNPCDVPFYKYYNINNGKLFGESACSFNNYQRFFVPNNPNLLA